MQESQFVSIFESVARKAIGKNAVVRRKANLFYDLHLNQRLQLAVEDTQDPKRGYSAFQTDICIFEVVDGLEFPRLAIEFKESISTHDIMTYSAKAGRHKGVYPCLRYGMLASRESFIPSRFFIHNEHMDFFIAAQNYKSESQLRPLARRLIEKELEISRTLERIHFNSEKVDYYCREIAFHQFGKERKRPTLAED